MFFFSPCPIKPAISCFWKLMSCDMVAICFRKRVLVNRSDCLTPQFWSIFLTTNGPISWTRTCRLICCRSGNYTFNLVTDINTSIKDWICFANKIKAGQLPFPNTHSLKTWTHYFLELSNILPGSPGTSHLLVSYLKIEPLQCVFY